jgi:hypothetical protein
MNSQAKIVNVNKIHVSYVDNELYIIASNQNESIELCHIKSGYNQSVDYKLYPPTILSSGEYQLIFVGINWGGPSGFQVEITGDSCISIGPKESENNESVGVFWSHVVNISVTSGSD